MTFISIPLEQFVRLHLKANPSYTREDVEGRLKSALAAHLAGKRCSCGNAIWVIGSAEVGYSCFTCITGQAVPDGDYELAEAL